MDLTHANSVTVPFHFEGNRVFVDLKVGIPNGPKRSARFWVDTGGGGFLFTESLAQELGFQWGEPMESQGARLAGISSIPEVHVGHFPLALDPKRTLVVLGMYNLASMAKGIPGHIDGLFPGHLLARYHVIFDYPNRLFTLAQPGILQPQGESMSMPVYQQTGFPRTEITVDGRDYGFLLDTGASFTIVSEAVLEQWSAKHPSWPRFRGAHGGAVTLGGQTLETMYVPSAQWGTYEVSNLGVTSQAKGTFERWMSSTMAAPIIGALGGNFLKHFRVELDYQKQTLYLQKP